jgi:hypothetical protein
MLRRRIARFGAAKRAAAFDAIVNTGKGAWEKAQALRASAARYRALAQSAYDRKIAAEVEGLARELESEATTLEMGTHPFLRTAPQ